MWSDRTEATIDGCFSDDRPMTFGVKPFHHTL
jgi:hypothetical protein